MKNVKRVILLISASFMLAQIKVEAAAGDPIVTEQDWFWANQDGSVTPFDLGEKVLSYRGGELTLSLKGSLSVPQLDGGHPIVFIIPEVGATQEVMAGYYYLLQALGKVNCLGVLLDLTSLNDVKVVDESLILTVFEVYRQELNKALQGEASMLEVSLWNKGSFSNVFFMGYGKSMDAIYEIIMKYEDRQFNLSGLLFIDPKRQHEVVHTPTPDVPTGIVLSYPMLEQNAVGLPIFQGYRNQESRTSWTSMVYVLPHTTLIGSSTQEYHNFISQYAVAFLQRILSLGPEGIGLSVHESGPQMLFDTMVKTALLTPNAKKIICPKTNPNPHDNVFGGNNRYQFLKLDHFKGLVDTYRLKWEGPGATLEIELPPELHDVSEYDALSFYINYHHSENKLLSFSVELHDVEGQVAIAKFENLAPLNYVSSTALPFYNERVILNALASQVDLTSIHLIRLVFDEVNTGEINIGDISLVKETR